MLDQSVYPTEEFKKQSKYYVFVKINGEKGEGPSLMKQYSISGFPTIKIFNADLQEVGGFVGYKPVGGVISSMDQARGGG
jgi:hypothetical protein